MTDETQWAAAQGALAAFAQAREKVDENLAEAAKVSDVLYEHAPDAYAKMVLPHLRQAADWLEWAIRVTADQSLAQSTMSQRELAAAAGVALTTIQRWSKEPAMAKGGEYGPGTIPDRRKRLS